MTPIIERLLDDTESDLFFSWSVRGKEVSTERNLEYKIPTDLDIGKHDCKFTVTDTKTGMTYYYEFNINVLAAYSWS